MLSRVRSILSPAAKNFESSLGVYFAIFCVRSWGGSAKVDGVPKSGPRGVGVVCVCWAGSRRT